MLMTTSVLSGAPLKALNIGVEIATNTIFWVPEYNYSRIYP